MGNHRIGECGGKNLHLACALAGNHLGDRSRNGRPSPMSRRKSRYDLLFSTPLESARALDAALSAIARSGARRGPLRYRSLPRSTRVRTTLQFPFGARYPLDSTLADCTSGMGFTRTLKTK